MPHNKIINNTHIPEKNKTTALEKLGFTQVREVEDFKADVEKVDLSKESLELVGYYRENYPFYKFITEKQVEAICHKYNLVCGNVGKFRGFVPQKNVDDMMDFKLKGKEKDVVIGTDVISYISNRKCPDIILEGAIIDNKITSYFHMYKKGFKGYAFQSDDGVNFYGKDDNNIFGLLSLGNRKFKVSNDTFQICAPIKDMDMKGMTISQGYRITKLSPPDPVVLRTVKGGYLIVTAWGDEASDPLVLNENHN